MRVLTVIPTYNEKENLPVVVERLRKAAPEVDILVVDDNSPDGTGQIADDLSAKDPQIHVLHRTVKDGLGGAYLAGFDWGLEAGYEVLIEMDADCSHQPEQLPSLVRAVEALTWPSARVTCRAARRRIGRSTVRFSRAALTCTPAWCWAPPSRTLPPVSARTAARLCSA